MRRRLTRRERLGRGQELSRLFTEGRRVSVPGLRLVARRNGRPGPRVAVVNARGYRGSVDRNRDRRVAREAYRAAKHELEPGYDYAIVLYPGPWGRAERRKQVEVLLRRYRRKGSPGGVEA